MTNLLVWKAPIFNCCQMRKEKREHYLNLKSQSAPLHSGCGKAVPQATEGLKKYASLCVRGVGKQDQFPVLTEALRYLFKNHLLIIYCFHSGSARHSGSGEDLSSSALYIPQGAGALVPKCLETLELPQVQERFSTKTELLSGLIKLQVCSLAKQLICTLAPGPVRNLGFFSSLRNCFIHTHIVL